MAGWQKPISCDDELDVGWLWEAETFACEGLEQRFVPTGVATRDNEIDDAPEFQQLAFSESGYFRKSLMGMDTTKWLQLA